MTKPILLDGVHSIGPHPATRTESEARADMVKTSQRPDIEWFLALAGKATPGEWKSIKGIVETDEHRCGVTAVLGKFEYLVASIENGAPGDFCETEEANADLVAAAKNTAPAIAQYALALEEVLTKLIAAAETLSEEADNFSVSGVYFNEDCMGHKGLSLVCKAIERARMVIGKKP